MSIQHTFSRNIITFFIVSFLTLLVGCGGGGSDNSSVQGENDDSAVSIVASTVQGDAPLTVKFSAESDDLILSAAWNFGDGVTAEPVNPNNSVTHTYTQDGTYTVALTAGLNLGGTQTNTIEVTVGSGRTADFGDINLIVSSFAIDREVTPGCVETISATIKNIGTDNLEGSGFFRVGYYLSTD